MVTKVFEFPLALGILAFLVVSAVRIEAGCDKSCISSQSKWCRSLCEAGGYNTSTFAILPHSEEEEEELGMKMKCLCLSGSENSTVELVHASCNAGCSNRCGEYDYKTGRCDKDSGNSVSCACSQ